MGFSFDAASAGVKQIKLEVHANELSDKLIIWVKGDGGGGGSSCFPRVIE